MATYPCVLHLRSPPPSLPSPVHLSSIPCDVSERSSLPMVGSHDPAALWGRRNEAVTFKLELNHLSLPAIPMLETPSRQ
ncbi:hypothetical protein DPEC_G00231130 [Dallia pectoralis]|uniref:Uncharacterized protein n=1 Tax=Dallia pectoralis TaxID=75939 RepID=A0ACC2FWZ3_DALPE|nr:hypothetical protein DPEC_G00231130 [Dallia pectoralis]